MNEDNINPKVQYPFLIFLVEREILNKFIELSNSNNFLNSRVTQFEIFTGCQRITISRLHFAVIEKTRLRNENDIISGSPLGEENMAV